MFVVLFVIDPTSHELGSPAKPARFKALMKAAASHFGGIDLLFNNAGTHDTDLTPHTAVHELPDEVWDMVCEVNLRSIWYGVRAALPYLRQ